MQDELTLSIVSAIEPNLRNAEIERAKRKRPDSLDAYDLFMRAQQHSYQSMMPGEADKALTLLHEALAIAPDYPAAHATAAWCYEMRYMRGGLMEADSKAALAQAQNLGAIAFGRVGPVEQSQDNPQHRHGHRIVQNRAFRTVQKAAPPESEHAR